MDALPNPALQTGDHPSRFAASFIAAQRQVTRRPEVSTLLSSSKVSRGVESSSVVIKAPPTKQPESGEAKRTIA